MSSTGGGARVMLGVVVDGATVIDHAWFLLFTGQLSVDVR